MTRRYGVFYEQQTNDLLFHFVNKPLKYIYIYILFVCWKIIK